ncbi:MAG: tetratricopeptide repeat protein [Gemmatimonadota bacterium]
MPWDQALELARVSVAGAGGGLLVGVGYPHVRHLRVVGQYVLGILAAGMFNTGLLYLSPFVRDSFFDGRPGYSDLVVPSVMLGLIATFELRRRQRRFRERFPGVEDSEQEVPWLQSLSLARQSMLALSVLLLGAGTMSAWGSYRRSGVVLEDYTVAWRDIAAEYPDDPEPHYYLARALIQARLWSEALTSAQRAVKLDATVSRYHETVGWALIGVARDREALGHFKEAVALAPADPRLWRDLARVALLVGDRVEARAAYERLDALTPTRLLWPGEDREAWADLQDNP